MRHIIFSSRSLIIILAIFLLFSVWRLHPLWEFKGDGHGYYSYLRSAWFDHDFDFTNEISRYDQKYGTNISRYRTPIGKIGNPFAIGMSVLWTPFFLLGHGVQSIFNISYDGLSGFSAPYAYALAFGTWVFIGIGIFFLFRGLQYFFEDHAIFLSILAIFGASPLIHYALYEPFMSHGASFGIAGVLFWYSARMWKKQTVSICESAWLGLIIGIALLIRWEHAILALLPAVIMAQLYRRKFIFWKHLGVTLLVGAACFIPQIFVWKYLYGSYLLIPQGDGFILPVSTHFFHTLFSPFHGLFAWHPFLFVGLLGLILAYKKTPLWSRVGLCIFFLVSYLHGSLSDWWGGSAFGARKMVYLLPFFAFGLAFLFSSLRRAHRPVFIGLLLGAIGWNYLLMVSSAKGNISLARPLPIGSLYRAPFLR